MPRSRHRAGRPYRRARAQMFQMFGDACHICGHAGAGEADHLTPISIDSDQPVDPYAMRPAHGANAPCPVCTGADGTPRKCNQERGNRPLPVPLRTSQIW
ncbi:hypothetical protein [Microtetraspora malaysiensis]|uniref:hypothetical protein n=1 Tax=Microtetraspora malaysiensis TaxID=161358 RepID=UPI003D91EE3E